MQNKKIFSVLLTFVLVVACVTGVLVLGADAEAASRTVPVDFEGYETIAAALEDVAAKEDWADDEYANIILADDYAEVVTVDADGILFGVDTIFVNGERLPITISGGTLTLPEEQTGNVVCSNSYTFKAMNFYLGDREVSFWAGSGEVVLDTVALSAETNALAKFYGDSPVAAAFDGWADPGENKIHTSLEFKNTNYKPTATGNDDGLISPTGATADYAGNVTPADIQAELILNDSKVYCVDIRPAAAMSSVSKVIFTTYDSSDNNSKTYFSLYGFGNASTSSTNSNWTDYTSVPCDVEVTFNGGTRDGGALGILGGAKIKGSATITINELKCGNAIAGSYRASATGDLLMVVNGGTFTSSDGLFGMVGGKTNTNRINGGNITTFKASRLMGTVTTYVTGGNISTFCGSYSSTSSGTCNATNHISGGEITTFYGGGYYGSNKAAEPNINSIKNYIYDGADITTFYASGKGDVVKNITTTMTGGSIGTYYGTADYSGNTLAVSVTGLENNITGGTIGTFYGTGPFTSYGSKQVNYFNVQNTVENATITGDFYGTGLLTNKNGRATIIYNKIGEGALIGGDYHGAVSCGAGNYTSLDYEYENEVIAGFETSAWKLKNEVNGGEIRGSFYGYTPVTITDNTAFSGSILNVIRGGRFCTSTLGEDANDGFYGIDTATKTVNGSSTTIVVGGEFCKGFQGTNYRPCGTSYTTTAVIAGGTFGSYQDKNDFVGADGGAYYANVTKNAQGGIIAVNGAPYVTDVVVTEEVTTYTAVAAGATLESTVQYYTFDGENYAEYTVTGEEGEVEADTYFTKTVTPATYVTYDETNPITEEGNKELFDSIMATAKVYVGDYEAYGVNWTNGNTGSIVVIVDDDADATAPIDTNCVFYAGNNTGINLKNFEVTVNSGNFDKNFYCVKTSEGYQTKTSTVTINVNGGTFNNLMVLGGTAGQRYDGTDYSGNVTFNMTGGKVTGTLYVWYIPVIVDENGVPTDANGVYNASVPDFHGNVTVNIEGSVDVERDEMNTAEGKAKLINIANIRGHIYTGLDEAGYVNLVKQTYGGTLTYNLKNVYISDTIRFACAANQKGNLDVSMENVLVKTIEDILGTTPGNSNSEYNGKVTGNISYYLKNCHVTYKFQWLNRSDCCTGTFTIELDSIRANGNSMREMNTSTGANTAYVYGDIHLDAYSGTPTKILFARSSKKNVAYVGAKLVDGVITPVPTTITGTAGAGIGNTYDASKSGYATMHVYDVTLKDGTVIDFGARQAGTNILHGDIALFDGSTVAASKVDADVEEIIVTVDDAWASETAYVTLTTVEDVAKLYGKVVDDSAFIAVKDTENGALLGGGTLDIAVSASLTVADRIYINMILDQAGVDAYLAAMVNANGEHALDYSIVIDLAEGAQYLGEGIVTAANLVDGSYKVQAGAVSANNFDKDITFQGKVFSATSSILDIAQFAIESEEYNEAEEDLFKAIYNYGASVLGLTMYEDFSEGFAITEGAKPVHQNKSETIQLKSASLLMGDAMGIRFKAQLAEGADRPALTLKVKVGEGEIEEVDSELLTILYGKNGEVYVNVYVSADYAEEDITFLFYADGEDAFAMKTNLQDYTAYVSGNGAAELACAQLIQAVVNY